MPAGVRAVGRVGGGLRRGEGLQPAAGPRLHAGHDEQEVQGVLRRVEDEGGARQVRILDTYYLNIYNKFDPFQGAVHQAAPAAARRAHQPPGPGGLRLARGGAEELQADPRPHLALAGNY